MILRYKINKNKINLKVENRKRKKNVLTYHKERGHIFLIIAGRQVTNLQQNDHSYPNQYYLF